jgi:hypothetical protein
MTPVFQNNSNHLPVCKQPSRHDKWWLIDRHYFDRAGWDDVYHVNIKNDIDFDELEIELPNNNSQGNINIENVDIDDSSENSCNSSNSDDDYYDYTST